NALLGYDRAIVTSTPGTTRDTIEEKLLLGKTLVRLTDTAGLRRSEDEVEREGIKRALRAAGEAELIIAVFDGSEPLGDEDTETINAAKQAKKSICVINKTDLPQRLAPEDLRRSFDETVCICAKTGEGISDLERAVARLCPEPDMPAGELLTNARQAEAVRRAADALGAALDALRAGLTPDAVLTEAEAALDALAELTGRSVKDDVTDRIFSRFCVGK
ncbi:MAG TPA: GTP-binding protein, partial [Candidatus Scatomorpha pullistercoris]|nr:GTP-binding protein [Candidatus Scatomorpha pullistercoris]